MSDKSNEQISNLMDGELEVNASQFLLKRMAADKSLSQTWENYHLVKSCLQKEGKEPLVIDIASRVSAELLGMQQQPTILMDKPVINKWLKPVMGIAIAASVAFMSVLMIQNQQIDGLNELPDLNIAGNVEVNQPIIKPVITANYANSGRSIVSPPAMLTRFPSVSAASNSLNYGQGLSNSSNMPYMIILNQSVKNKTLSPMQNKDLSD